LFCAALLVLAAGRLLPARAQQLSGPERERGRMMLKIVKDDIKEHYYDPTFHGVDLDARFKEADDKIKQATSNSQVFAIIAQALLDLKDSHTFFLPPPRGFRIEYGWQMQAIGDACFVTVVKPGSDAEAKGLKPGDQVISVDGYKTARENVWVLNYLFRGLYPRSAQRLIVQGPGEQPRQLDIASKVREGTKLLDLTSGIEIHNYILDLQAGEHLRRNRFHELNDDVLIWKLQEFGMTDKETEGVMGRIKKYKTLILDLRENPGGYVDTLRHLVGYFLGEEVKIADLKTRKETKPVMSRKVGGAYEGKLIILADSGSASAAEVFARVMQLKKRAVIIGDRTAGAVMESRQYGRALGTDSMVFYGTSITDADIIMTDGKSLERAGVTPDELILPTGEDLRAVRDPVLARAAAIAGVKLDPAQAAALFPVEWPKIER
jgi:carboxyl-terminal processing protease